MTQSLIGRLSTRPGSLAQPPGLAWIAMALLTVTAILSPVGSLDGAPFDWTMAPIQAVLIVLAGALTCCVAAGRLVDPRLAVATLALSLVLGAIPPLVALSWEVLLADGFGGWMAIAANALTGWLLLAHLADARRGEKALGKRGVGILVPTLFGIGVIYLWEVLVRGFDVPRVLLPAPSAVFDVLTGQVAILAADFRQTFLKAVLAGFVLGSGSAFLAALAIDRSPFLQRGLLPLGSLVSAIPIVGIAPIMVMWFGFDWESKAAVIVVMTFFPMLISTLAGLATADHMQRDLMRSYAASYWQTLFFLRLPAALPMIFNALKLNSTLALIGAIVAEFFGTPIVGMGFRISTEVARMNVDVVWATIAVASVAGSAFYGLLAVVERAVTFWHPSFRKGR